MSNSPHDGHVELVLPIPVAAAQRGVQGRRQAVPAGAVLARWSTSGSPGARPGAARKLSREMRLPQGPNTEVSADGTQLIASCAGEVLMRNLLVEIVPMHIHEGDITGDSALLRTPDAVFVTGSVEEHAQIEAGGEVYIQGHVSDAQIRSGGSGITVMSYVSGQVHQPTILRAAEHVLCGPVRHAHVIAGGDIRLFAGAWQATLKAGGNVYVPQSLEHSLLDVHLHIEGGLFPTPLSIEPDSIVAQDRQHVRITTRLRALIALHGTPPLTFHSCTILDLSVGGARCHMHSAFPEPAPDAIVQLKFVLPTSGDYVLIIGRVVRRIADGVIGLAFLQMTQRHQQLLTTFCLQLLLSRAKGNLAHRDSRKSEDSAL